MKQTPRAAFNQEANRTAMSTGQAAERAAEASTYWSNKIAEAASEHADRSEAETPRRSLSA
jgi:hypothetical protein